jgi:hypothetical protein
MDQCRKAVAAATALQSFARTQGREFDHMDGPT